MKQCVHFSSDERAISASEISATSRENQAPSTVVQPATGHIWGNSALLKATKKARDSISPDPRKFAAVIRNLIAKASEEEVNHLREEGVLRTWTNEEEEVIRRVLACLHGKTKSEASWRVDRAIAGRLNEGLPQSSLNAVAKFTGFSRKFLKNHKKTDNEEYGRKTRTDATSDAVKETVKNFYLDEATILPTSKHAKKNTEAAAVLHHTISVLHGKFKDEHPAIKLCRSVFAELRPAHIKLKKSIPLVGSLCDYCANAALLLKTVNDELKKLGLKELIIYRVSDVIELSVCSGLKAIKFKMPQGKTK